MAILLVAPATLQAFQISGFTRPFRQIELACDESGSIAELFVKEGDQVKRGQILARLDDRVQKLQVETASHLATANSSLEAARLSFEKRKLISSRIRELNDTGNATDSEMIRADMEYTIAQSRFMAAREEAVSRELDLKRARLMLERRTIRAPFDGVISAIHHREGEFLSPVRPELATLVDTSQLLAEFNIPSSELATIRTHQTFRITMSNEKTVTVTLYSIGVETDAESGTVRIRMLIPNESGELRAGEQCFLQL